MTLNYWSIIGTIYLIILTWQDYKNNRWVDDRRNFFMLGLSVSLISHVVTSIWYKLALSVIVILLNIFMRKTKALGEADVNSITWIFTGFGLINPYILVYFLAILTALTLFYMLLKRLFGIRHPIQYYGVLLVSFMVINIIYGLY